MLDNWWSNSEEIDTEDEIESSEEEEEDVNEDDFGLCNPFMAFDTDP